MKKVSAMLALIVLPIAMAMGGNLLDGLVGYWPFDGDAKDYSGNGNNGNLHGVSFTNGRRGSSLAAHFGGNDYVSVPASGKISRIFDFSVTAWMKINRYETASDGTKWCSFVSKGGDSIRQFGVQFGVNTNGAAFYQLVAGDRIPCPKIPINTWTHIAVTRSGLNASLYINGVGVAGGTSKSYPEQHSGNLEIGRDSPGEVEYFHGEMSDVCLFNRALSAAEVSAIYNGGLKLGKVVFNANAVEVEGTMPSLSVLSGTQEKLPENAFRRHDGYVFQGWAKSKSDADNGIVEYQDEEEITIESDMTLYAVWANPPLTLVAESANWSSGSITLKATGVSLKEGEDFFLSYCDAATADSDGAQWEYVDDFGKTVDGNSISVTDSQYSSRLGGIPAVRYRLQIGKSKDDVRVTMCCTTRNRHGIFVGVGHYSDAYQTKCRLQTGFPLENLPEVETNTERYSNMVRDCGKFDIKNLIGNGATTETLDAAFVEKVENVSPGDIFLFYVATHGGFDGTDDAVLSLYDDDYSDVWLKRGIDALADKGSAVICILSACQSEALVRQSRANVAVIAAANYRGSSTALFDEILMDYGWSEGWAGTSGMLTFGALAGYVEERYNALFRGIMLQEGDELTTRDVQVENRGMLSRITAGTCGTHGSMLAPATPSGFTATQATSKNEITLSWNGSGNVDYYVFYGGTGGGAYENYTNTCKTSMTFSRTDFACVESSSESSPVPFEIRAFNRAGVSSSAYTQGWVDGTWKIVFWAGKGKMVGDWMGMPVLRNMAGVEYFEKVMQRHETLSLTSLPLATRDGYTCTGWISENQKVCTKASVGMVLSKESDDMRFVAAWTAMTTDYLNLHPPIAVASGGDIATAAAMTAANGCRTVGECYALGIDPEDPDDDFKILDFKIEDGKPVITLNHTKDGSGNSFEPRIKTLGKANLTDADWVDVTDKDQSPYRFFKVTVDMP